MKPALGVLALALLTFAPSSVRAEHVKEEHWNKHWAVGLHPELRIHAGDAAVTVVAGSAKGIDANLTTRGWTIGALGVQVKDHQTGNVVEIDVQVPSTHFDFGSHEIRLEVRVPREIATDIHTGDGSIRLEGLHGTIRANTGDGGIQGEDLDGSLDAQSGDGSLHIAGRFDSVHLHTQDGSVELSAGRGSRMQSDWRVQTGDGSVSVTVPRHLAADVDLHTGDGSIHLDVPALAVAGAQSEHDVRGKLNGGGPAFTVRTGDGSISVGS